jgi:hypothetical protein
MSREQLVELYLRGQIGRRTFIRKLVKAGISITAAATYAELLVPQPALAGARGARGDLYSANNPKPTAGTAQGQPAGAQAQAAAADTTAPGLTLAIPSFRNADLGRVGGVAVELSSDEAATVELETILQITPRRGRAASVSLGRQSVAFDAAGGRSVRFALTSQARRALRGARRVSATCSATAKDAAGNQTTRSASTIGG